MAGGGGMNHTTPSAGSWRSATNSLGGEALGSGQLGTKEADGKRGSHIFVKYNRHKRTAGNACGEGGCEGSGRAGPGGAGGGVGLLVDGEEGRDVAVGLRVRQRGQEVRGQRGASGGGGVETQSGIGDQWFGCHW